ALDVAVVVDLDAPRRPRQRKDLGQQLQQLALGRTLGKLARQRLARIGERVIDEILLLAALGHAHLDLVAALGAQGLGEQRALLDLVGDEDGARARLVVVKLGEKRAQHLAGRERAVGLGEIRAIAPVLAGAEKEHLHAVEAAGLMHGEHVGLLDPARIDALMRLHRRERGETVAADGGARWQRAAREAFSTSAASPPFPAWLLPDRNAFASRTSSPYSAKSISRVQGPEQRLIWYSKHGRVRLSKNPSEQERSRNARCSAVMVRLTAQTEANGPQ